MRLVFAVFSICVCLPALAQVTTNDQALDALKPAHTAAPPSTPPPSTPPPSAPAPRPAMRHTARRATHAAPPAKPPPQVPAAPPANPVIAPPIFVMPAHPRPNPPPVPIKADAPGEVSPITGGSRITFGPGVASLNQATHDAILAYAARARANPALMISVTAWAPGTPDDPSPARTLALERALAARAVLINAGVPSERILAVSRGMEGVGAGPPDRLEITAAAPRQTPAGAPLSPPAPAHAIAAPAPSLHTAPVHIAPAHAVPAHAAPANTPGPN
jgi:outer membrane protein OmpA-like peptidoglycan-associated protein